ncbi:hypothetical protein FKP32DRAFT_158632 [Trametes sanguinea]|nr:hypothetical protein FKP32DRAFT_158632 [Trametes sanguinea]
MRPQMHTIIQNTISLFSLAISGFALLFLSLSSGESTKTYWPLFVFRPGRPRAAISTAAAEKASSRFLLRSQGTTFQSCGPYAGLPSPSADPSTQRKSCSGRCSERSIHSWPFPAVPVPPHLLGLTHSVATLCASRAVAHAYLPIAASSSVRAVPLPGRIRCVC